MFLSSQLMSKRASTALSVMSGQKLRFLVCLIGVAVLLWLVPAIAYAEEAAPLIEAPLENANYSIGPGGAGGTTKITCYTLPGGATKWRVIVQAGALTLVENETPDAADYESGEDISVETGKHLILLATDYANRVKAYKDITVADTDIRAYDLELTTNYSAPEPGGAAETTKISTLSLPDGASKWYINVQSSAFPIPSLGDTVGAGNFTEYDKYKENIDDDPDISVQAGQHLMLLAVDNDVDKRIMAFVDLPISAGQISNMVATLGGTIVTAKTGEGDIRNGDKTLTITLSGNSWDGDLKTDKLKQDLLIDNLVASGTGRAEWEKVITALKLSPNISVGTDSVKVTSTVTIKFPTVNDYNITADQTVTVNIPPSLLSYTATVEPTPQTFTIVADKTAFITGTIAPTASHVTEADIRAGGKTITITLVNDTWATDIATDRLKRDALFNEFTATDDPTAPLAGWNAEVINALKASATITRVSPTKITIIMPKVPDYNIDKEQTIKLEQIPGTCLASGSDLKIPSASDEPSNPVTEVPSFTIKSVNPSATISGSAVTALTTEANIVAGGKTIIITLIDDTWEDDVVSTKTKREALVECLSADVDPNNKWKSVKTAINTLIDSGNPNIIVRTSDSVVTITLPAVTGYDISDDQTIKFTLKGGLDENEKLTVENIGIVAPPAFTIKPVTATAGGTVVTTATSREDIVKGGKTIIITLYNSTWVPDVATNPDKVKLLADGITGNTDAGEWQKVMTALKASTGKTKVSGAALTITLPPVPDYFIQDDQTVTVTIDKRLLRLPTAAGLQVSPTFKIFASALPPATAMVSFDPELSATDIKDGTDKAKFIITLTSDTWVGDIATNKNNLVTLIDGFTAATDAGQWELVKSAVKNSGVLSKDADNIITITIPLVSSYNIVADQVVSIKIPKALLNLTKADLAATPSITIKAVPEGNLEDMLLDGSLDALLENHSPTNIFVNVQEVYE